MLFVFSNFSFAETTTESPKNDISSKHLKEKSLSNTNAASHISAPTSSLKEVSSETTVTLFLILFCFLYFFYLYIKGRRFHHEFQELKNMYTKAVKEILGAVEKESASGKCAIGLMLLNKGNFKESCQWFAESANQGFSPSQFLAASICDVDKAMSYRWLKKAAKKGEPHAQMILGEYYLNEWIWLTFKDTLYGDFIENNDIAGHNYSPDGMYSPFISYRWHLKSAKNGISYSQLQTGRFLKNGFGGDSMINKLLSFFIKSKKKAFKWYKINCENKIMYYPESLFEVAVMYEKGIGVQRNFKEALRCYKLLLNTDAAAFKKKAKDALERLSVIGADTL